MVWGNSPANIVRNGLVLQVEMGHLDRQESLFFPDFPQVPSEHVEFTHLYITELTGLPQV